MGRILHVSQNQYMPLGENGSTERIWQELSQDCEEYHILGRSYDNRFHHYHKNKIHLHTIPRLGKRNIWFALTSILVGIYARKYQIEGIVCQCPVLGGIWSVRYGMTHNVPVLIELHGNEYFRILRGKRIRDRIGGWLIRYSLERAVLIRALNEDMMQQLVELGVRNKGIRVVYNRADFKLFNKPKTDFNLHVPIKIITVGAFSKLKGHELIFRTIQHIAEDMGDYQITLIGGGNLYEYYEQLSRETGIKCDIYNRIPQSQIVDLMSECDIYIHPSYSEGVSRAIIEAMAMRMPIIATNVGFTSGTVINDVSGIIVPAGDVTCMGEALKRLLRDKNLRQLLAENAYKDAIEKYEWNHCFNKYRKLIVELLKAQR